MVPAQPQPQPEVEEEKEEEEEEEEDEVEEEEASGETALGGEHDDGSIHISIIMYNDNNTWMLLAANATPSL